MFTSGPLWMDNGHGGNVSFSQTIAKCIFLEVFEVSYFQVCADYASTHLIPSLEKSVQKLKILTSKLIHTEKLKIYEKHFEAASDSVLRYLEISDPEYEEIKGSK